jgi:hypothetical protein
MTDNQSQVHVLTETIAKRMYDALLRAPSYATARRLVAPEAEAHAASFPLQPLTSVHEPDPADYDWIHERPPLAWYSHAITSHIFAKTSGAPTSPRAAVRLMRAANYYGDPELALEVAARSPHALETDLEFEFRKLVARAHKNDGRYEASGRELLEALAIAASRRNHARVSYLLLLYAKLCEDYQQRVGWYRVLHEIAFARMSKVDPGFTTSKQIRRWLGICADSLASAVYRTDPTRAESLFELSLIGTRDEEGGLRALSHRAILRLECTLAAGTVDAATISDSVTTLARVVAAHEISQNERGGAVRRLEFLESLRLLASHGVITDRVLGTEIPAVSFRVAIREALDVHRTASRLSDSTCAARALLELAMWHIAPIPSRGTKPDLETGAKYLLDAKLQLQGERRDVPSGLYSKVLDLLYETCAKLERWQDCRRVAEEAFEYHRQLIDAVRRDSDTAAGASRLARGHSDPLSRALSFLHRDELGRLQHAVTEDYRILLNRGLDVTERLRDAFSEASADQARRWISVSHGARMHDIKGLVNELKRRVRNRDSVSGAIREFDAYLCDWATERRRPPWDLHPMEMLSAIRRIVPRRRAFSEFQDWIQVQGSTQPHQFVLFSEDALGVMLENLILNVRAVALARGLTDWRVLIEVFFEAGHAVLGITDTIGEFERFSDVIDRVNRFSSVESIRGDEGDGLSLVRECTHVALSPQNRKPWRLVRVGEHSKRLEIPVADIVESSPALGTLHVA